ncbi:hypothetical protein [Bosea rubneri]|uniref:Uncharacterized protein n=1 Tax=Bosea rubneri TaxID=3075434 RepID=A0ABU3S462_9HYPH|nr:hypothetical protein [Bosea sp. ZW T0_25]MDU0339574.1 hypothetical protein [Bosea sp. ZW T0_25]
MHQLIVTLDRHLCARGQSATLRRRIGTGSTFVELPIRVRLQGYATTDVVAGIKVTDSKFITSPTPIVEAGAAWPGAAGGGTDIKIGDWLFVEGRQRSVAQVDNVRIGDALVRIEGRISG